jgi:N-acylneuraminate cytidylyltransferase
VHALDWLADERREPTNVVHMRPTTPFRDPAVVDLGIATFVANEDASALRSVHEMSQSAYKSLEVAPSGWLQLLGSDGTAMDEANIGRQFFPTTFIANGYVDVLSVEFIRATRLLHGDRVLPFRTQPVLEVDTEDDMEHLEFQLMREPELLTTVFTSSAEERNSGVTGSATEVVS